ncbi:MAG: polysaccharide pyruvyl transferase family protein [Planctomycetota bacterium]
MKICLLGALFDTGNLGVSALAESSIKCIVNNWPDATVTVLGGRRKDDHKLRLFGREVCVKRVPVRFCKNVFIPNHYSRFFMYALLFKVLRSKRLRKLLVRRNPYVKALAEADMIVDIAGGDSFSDIYGLGRFVFCYLTRWLVMMFDKKLVMLPQTYGPFTHSLSRLLARRILNHACMIYSRDKAGLDYVKGFLNHQGADRTIRFCPDVAFVLDAHESENFNKGPLEDAREKGSLLVGLNISGLLFSGGYTRNNMFGLEVDYPGLVHKVVESLMQNPKVLVLLVPHVLASGGAVESDTAACQKVYEQMGAKYVDRIFMVQGDYNQNEIKYIIGLCDFFIGSRMHSCIAALSQYVPALGLAYSKKFLGVFESIGLTQCVADARTSEEDQLLETIESVFEQRHEIRKHLERTIPGIQRDVLNIF